MATKFEIELDVGVMEMVKKIAERRETTQKETVQFLVGTGAGRYLAATTWADANKKPVAKKAPKAKVEKAPKAKAAKSAKKAPAAKPAPAAKAKAPKVRKAPSQEKMDKISAEMEKAEQTAAEPVASVLD